MDFNLA